MIRQGASRLRQGLAALRQQQRGIAFKQITPGTRPTVAGVPVTVFGGTGFVGRYVVNAIGKTGSQVIAPYRGDEMSIRHLKVNGDLGQIVPVPFHPLKPETIAMAVEKSTIVINLIGKNYKTWNYSFNDVNVNIPAMIARVCKEVGVHRLIHFSALAADYDAPSEYARTKARGEDAVREEFPEATIVRPAQIFGHEDRFITKETAAAKSLKWYPIIGAHHLTQPTYVGDVAAAVLQMARDGDTQGKVYELAGPTVYERGKLLREAFEVAGLWTSKAFNLPAQLALPVGFANELLPLFEPFWTRDTLRQLTQDIVKRDDALGYENLGLVPDTFEKHAVTLLRRFRPPKATIGFEYTRTMEEVRTWPDDLEEREIALGPFKRLNIRDELKRIQ